MSEHIQQHAGGILGFLGSVLAYAIGVQDFLMKLIIAGCCAAVGYIVQYQMRRLTPAYIRQERKVKYWYKVQRIKLLKLFRKCQK